MKKILLFLFLIPVFAAAQKTTGGNYTYIAQRYEWLTGIFQAFNLPAGDSARHKSGQDMRSGAVYLDTVNTQASPAGFYIYKNGIWELQADEDICQNRLIDPITVTYTGTGMRFFVSGGRYQIGCNFYYLDSATVTLADGEADPRIDAIILTASGVDTLKGVAAASPVKPQVDGDQIELTFVNIAAAATQPTLTTHIIYDENTESTVTNTGTTTDPDNTSNVYRLTKSINVTNINNNDIIHFTLPAQVNVQEYDAISGFIDLKAAMSGAANLRIRFFNGATAVSNEVTIGLNKNSTNWQGWSVPISNFAFSNTYADRVNIRYTNTVTTVHAGFYLDYIHLAGGFTQPGGGTSNPITLGTLDGKPANSKGATIESDVLYMQTATDSLPGLLSPILHEKLNNQKWEYFIQNATNLYDTLLFSTNDSTVKAKALKDSTGIGIIDRGDYLSIYNTGGTTPTLQQVLTTGSTLTVPNTISTPGNSLSITSNSGGENGWVINDSSTVFELRRGAMTNHFSQKAPLGVAQTIIRTAGMDGVDSTESEINLNGSTIQFKGGYQASPEYMYFNSLGLQVNKYAGTGYRLIGSSATGLFENIILGTNLSMSGNTLNATGGGGGGNLLFDSLGTAGISPVTARNDTLYSRRISISGGSIDTTASGGLLITVTGGSSYTFSTGLTEAAGTVTNNLSTGVSGGQSVIGGTASGNSLTLSSTSHATKGNIVFGAASVYDEVNNRLGIGNVAPTAKLQVQAGTLAAGGNAILTTVTMPSNVGALNGESFTATGSGSTSQTLVARSTTFAAGYTGAGTNVAGVFLNQTAGTGTGAGTTAGNVSYRPIGNIGAQVRAEATATGNAVGGAFLAGGGNVSIGGWMASTATKNSGTNVGLVAFGRNAGTTPTQVGGYFALADYGSSLPTFTSAALIADNGSQTDPIFLGRDNGTTVFTIADGGNTTLPLIKITGGSPGAGKVLTSDADGDATWETATKPTLTKNATIENPTASENMGWFRTPVAITITNTHAVLVGSSTPSVTYQISFGTDITSLTNVYTAGQTVTSTTTGTAASGVNDATIPANSWIRITTSAQSGTVGQISLSITYTED